MVPNSFSTIVCASKFALACTRTRENVACKINVLSDDGTFVGSFGVLLIVHLSIFISVFNQLDAQNLFHNNFYFMPLHVLSTCAHHQEVKIALHSLWYHHTYRWPSRSPVLIIRRSKLHYTGSGIITTIGGRLVHGLSSCAVTVAKMVH